MEGAYFLFCNDYEFGLISKKTGWSLDQILEHVKVLVITRGKDGADLYSDGNSVHIPTVPEDEIVDPTGVGDAFRGGFLAGLLARLRLEVVRRDRLALCGILP
jgi:adenosine kinase